MTRRSALTNEALVALGAEKLAKLVLDGVGRNAPFKKLVTAALAGAKGPGAVAAIIDRRLSGWSAPGVSSTGRSARPSRPTSGQRSQPSQITLGFRG